MDEVVYTVDEVTINSALKLINLVCQVLNSAEHVTYLAVNLINNVIELSHAYGNGYCLLLVVVLNGTGIKSNFVHCNRNALQILDIGLVVRVSPLQLAMGINMYLLTINSHG